MSKIWFALYLVLYYCFLYTYLCSETVSMAMLFYSNKEVKKWKHTPFLCFTTGILYGGVDFSHKGWSIWLRNIRYCWADILNHTCKYEYVVTYQVIRCFCINQMLFVKIAICFNKEQWRIFTFLHIVIYFLCRNTVGWI